MPTPPNTVTTTNHGLLIQVGGVVIGAIHSWAPSMARAVTEVYAFGDDSTVLGQGSAAGSIAAVGAGDPYENVPGNVTGLSIRVDRYDLYNKQMESQFTKPVTMTMLSDQLDPFEVVEVLKKPSAQGRGQNTSTYQGCWFTSLGRTHSATDDRIVKVGAELKYTRKITV